MYMTKEMNAEFAKCWKTPIIFIQAEPGLRSVTPNYDKVIAEGKALCSSNENFSSVVVPGPHHVHLTNSERVAQVIQNFFQGQSLEEDNV